MSFFGKPKQPAPIPQPTVHPTSTPDWLSGIGDPQKQAERDHLAAMEQNADLLYSHYEEIRTVMNGVLGHLASNYKDIGSNEPKVVVTPKSKDLPYNTFAITWSQWADWDTREPIRVREELAYVRSTSMCDVRNLQIKNPAIEVTLRNVVGGKELISRSIQPEDFSIPALQEVWRSILTELAERVTPDR